jgi:hypothetical protein
MKECKNSLGLSIMTGLIVLGLMMPIAVANFKSYDRTVDVKGLCEKEVMADKVIWPISFTVVGDDLLGIYNETDANIATITKFLTDGGLPESAITYSTPRISDKYAQEYGNNDRRFRYLSKSIITVCSENVELVRKLMQQQTTLLKKGISLTENAWENPVQFKFEGLNEIKPEMIEEATVNARAAAQKFAKDSGSKLGKIKSANQGTFTIADRDSNTPYIKTVRVVTSVTYYLKR